MMFLPSRNSAKLCVLALLALLCSHASDVPMPDPELVKQRALTGINRASASLENYSCTVDQREDELNANGSIKRAHRKESERFFVNGRRVDHLLAEDGKPLTGSAEAKEQSRVDNQVRRFSDEKKMAAAERNRTKELNSFVRALSFQNGHRLMRDGRSVLVYDLRGDPNFKPADLLERFAKALDGRIWLDEAALTPIEINLQTDQDVKVAGGLLGNLHKGFRLHLIWQYLDNSVWLEKQADGRGDASELFAHSRFAFDETVKGCRKYHVETQSTAAGP